MIGIWFDTVDRGGRGHYPEGIFCTRTDRRHTDMTIDSLPSKKEKTASDALIRSPFERLALDHPGTRGTMTAVAIKDATWFQP